MLLGTGMRSPKQLAVKILDTIITVMISIDIIAHFILHCPKFKNCKAPPNIHDEIHAVPWINTARFGEGQEVARDSWMLLEVAYFVILLVLTGVLIANGL